MQITMPKLGLTMTHGTVTEWLKAPGDAVRAEEALCIYETEKVSLELPSPQDGVLTQILAPVGEAVAAGTPICVVEAADDRPSTTGDRRPVTESGTLLATPKARALARQHGINLRQIAGRGLSGRVHAADVLAAVAQSTHPARAVGSAVPAGEVATLKATPLARRIAAAEGLDLRAIVGGGPDGTITREDVEEALRDQGAGGRGPGSGDRGQESVSVTQPAPARGFPLEHTLSPGETVVPLTSLRRVIGERMSQSAFNAPHVTLLTEAEATHLVSARNQLNEELTANGAGSKIAFNTLIAALVARALRAQPQLNSRLEPDGIHLLSQINIALAVDTERGLMTPVLPRVDELSLLAIQRGYDALIGRAMAGKSLPDDFVGGTFTITNLGALDVDGFTPIINPPQAAILGVGRIIEKPVAREGAVVIRPMVALSLSFDHRIVDGAPAARFLQRVKQLVERPMALLV
ncbi:MAG: 2-oxo acid dehydrogenase subunit E2 [Anaerolineae bacterium]|nr:2-oxo acid dehydrogenase subunit E2 [Anaerolineae bacterium]